MVTNGLGANALTRGRPISSEFKAIFTLYWIAFVPAREPYRIGLLFRHKSGDFGANSIRERSCDAPLLNSGELHIA